MIQQVKKNIIAIGRLLWEKDLASVLNGNISVRLDDNKFLLTATRTCLGLLHEKDILLMDLDGNLLEEGSASTEKFLHAEIYKAFPDSKAIIHTHTTFTNAYFLRNEKFVPEIFEAKLFLGEVQAIVQQSPSVTDMTSVSQALRKNNIVVLKHHGAVSMGDDLFNCFLLIQSLEEAIKTDAFSRLWQEEVISKEAPRSSPVADETRAVGKYKIFSPEQIDAIVELVNADPQMRDLGAKSEMTMDLAIKCAESGQAYCFHFEKGRIKKCSHDEQAEFVITAPLEIWRAVFHSELDPFVATTQKRMQLKGDFAKISRWYAPCSRIFQLWQQVPVE